MTKDEELQSAYNQLDYLEKVVIKLKNRIKELERVQEIIIAAGLLDRKKFEEAETIMKNLSL